jgi:predicted Fe-S protein YdhL (DUF1289 family)
MEFLQDVLRGVGPFMLGMAVAIGLLAWFGREHKLPHVSPYCRVCGRKVEISAWPVRADPETGRAERYEVWAKCPAFHAEGAGNSWLAVSPEDLERIDGELAEEAIDVRRAD